MEENICKKCAYYDDCELEHKYNDKSNCFVLDMDIDDYIREDEENKKEVSDEN